MRQAMEHRMLMRAVFCVPVIAGGMIGAALALGVNSASAAECLAEPSHDPPQGSHWFYRVDRATERKCWYLRAWTPPPSSAPTEEVQRPTARSPAGQTVRRNRPLSGESAPAAET